MCVLMYTELYIVLLRIVSSSSVYSTTNLGNLLFFFLVYKTLCYLSNVWLSEILLYFSMQFKQLESQKRIRHCPVRTITLRKIQEYCHRLGILHLILPADTRPIVAYAITRTFKQPQCPRTEQWYSHAHRHPRVSRMNQFSVSSVWLEVHSRFH